MAGYDQLFKGLLRTFFGDFLALLSAQVAERLDASRAEFLDKEFFTDWPRGRRRELDLLARVPIRTDSRRSALVHVEIELRARPGIGQRLRRYRNQIQSVHDDQVVSAVVFLSRGQPGVNVQTLDEDLFEMELGRFRYFTFGIAGCRAEEYLARPQPLAWGLAALMKRGSWSRATHKHACLSRIAGAALDEVQRFLLVNCVETHLELDPREAAEYEALCARDGKNEESAMKTARMTWADRIRDEGWREGMENGLERGKEQGARRILLRLLGLRFGPLPDAVRERVEAIDSLETLTELADRVLVARSIDELGLP
jgi:hypothetical protein